MAGRFDLGALLRIASAPRLSARTLSTAGRQGGDLRMASSLAVDAGFREVNTALERYRIRPAHWILWGVLLVENAVAYNNLRRLKAISRAMEELEAN